MKNRIITILNDAENEVYVNPNEFIAAWTEENKHGTVGWVMFGTFKFRPLDCLSDVIKTVKAAIGDK